MSHQFKPGDLALIVGASRFPENIGAVVELVAYVPASGIYKSGGELLRAERDAWQVAGESVVGACRDLLTGQIRRTPGHGIVNPAHLMPLHGEPEQPKQKSREVPA